MSCSTAGFPVQQQIPELTQTQTVHRVGDAIQPPHPLSSHYPPTFNLSQHQGLFKLVSSSHQVDKVSEFQLQHQSFQWIFRTDFPYDGLVGSPWQSKGLSRVFFSTTVQKHQFFGAQPFLWSDSHHLNCISNVCKGQRDHCFVLSFQRTETVNLCVAAPWFVIGITRATTAFLFPDISLNFSFL